MLPPGFAQHPPPAGAENKAFLDKVGFDHVFQRVAGLGEGGGEGFDTDRAAGVVLRDAPQITAVHQVQAQSIDLQTVQRGVGNRAIHRRVALHGGEITDPAQQPAGDARGAARPAGDLGGSLLGQAEARAAGRRGR